MSSQEWNSFFGSVKDAFILLLPSLIVSIIISLTDFFSRHFRKEPFRMSKLICGAMRDLMLGGVIAAVCFAMHVPHGVVIGVVAICVERGRNWVFSVVDAMLCTRLSEYHGPDRRVSNRQNEYNGPYGRKNDKR